MARHAQSHEVPKSVVNKIIRGASPRIEHYNRICSSCVIGNIGKPAVAEVDAETKLLRTDMSAIQKLMIMRLNTYAYDAIHKIKPSNVYEAAKIIDSEVIHHILMNTLMAFSEETDVELLVSWMSCINSRTTKFIKIMLNEFAKSKLTDRLFKEKTQEAMLVFLDALFKKIIETAASKTIPPGDDIYRTILRKKIIINKSV
jgi:hypothetical protein